MRILVVDNYDSFTYNLVQYLGQLGCSVEVYRNDEIGLSDIQETDPDRIVISPGPGVPKDAGISLSLVKKFAGKIPILGVCLGHLKPPYYACNLPEDLRTSCIRNYLHS